jgi:hypothetical protein
LEELCSRLEGAGVRICDQFLGSSPGQACWADRLEEAVERLKVTTVERCQADAELEALWASAALDWDQVLGGADGSSSLAASLTTVAKEVEKRINAAATNRVQWGARSALVVVLSHFLELETELKLLGSG